MARSLLACCQDHLERYVPVPGNIRVNIMIHVLFDVICSTTATAGCIYMMERIWCDMLACPAKRSEEPDAIILIERKHIVSDHPSGFVDIILAAGVNSFFIIYPVTGT